jgi:hypothetical protein
MFSTVKNCIIFIFFLIFLCFSLLCIHRDPFSVPLSSPQGQAIFAQSDHRNYWRMAQFYVTQDNMHYCGIASMVMVLNSLNIPAPKVFPDENYRLFTQENLFTLPAVRALLDPKEIATRGVIFKTLAHSLETFALKVNFVYAGEYPYAVFHREFVKALIQDGHYVVACYDRGLLHQQGSGHCSPLAAYDDHTDRVLIMDVSRFDGEPFWVTVEDLYIAMKGDPHSLFLTEQGYIEVSSATNNLIRLQ